MKATVAALAAVVALAAAAHAEETAAERADRLQEYSKLLDAIRYNPTPAPNNPELDCMMRDVAYDFSLKLLPQRSPLKSVWDAMELTTRCNRAWPPSEARIAAAIAGEATPAGFPVGSMADGHAAGAASANFSDSNTWYCDARTGSDSNSGTKDSPFKTIQKGIQASRGVSAGTPRSVILREGTFYPSAMIELGSADSGLSIEAYPGEEPTVSGATPLPGLDWKPFHVSPGARTMVVMNNSNDIFGCCQPGKDGPGVKYIGVVANADACQQACVADAECTAWTFENADQGKYANMCYVRTDGKWEPTGEPGITSGHWVAAPNVWVADLPAGIELSPQTYGMLRGQPRSGSTADDPSGSFDWSRTIRARYPNVRSPETDFFPTGWQSGGVSWGPIRDDNTSYTPVFVESPEDPSAGLFTNFQGAYGGHCDIFKSDNFSFWCGEHTNGGGAFPFKQPWGVTFSKGAMPVRINASSVPGKVVFHTWREAHWATWDFVLDSYDAQPDGSIVANWTVGGFQGARGASKGAEWWVDNALELLDAANEFYIDTDAKKLYYFANDTSSGGAPSGPTGLFAPMVLPTIFNVSASQSDPAKGVAFRGLRLVGASASYLLPHLVPSGGDWSLSPFAALYAQGTEGLSVENCLFERHDGHGLFLRGYHRGASVSNNEFAWLGSTAIVTFGDSVDSLMDMTHGNFPDSTLIADNLIREVGVGPKKQESCIFEGKVSRNIVTDLVCINGPRAGYNKNDNGPRGPIINRTFIGNQCRESSDHGPFNSWDRQPFLFLDGDGQRTVTPEPSVITGNYLMGNYGSSMTQDNDDGSAYYLSSGNVMYGGGHKSNFGGHNKISDGNLNIYARVYGPTCFRISSTAGPDYKETYVNNTCIIDPTAGSFSVYDMRITLDDKNKTNNDFTTGNNRIFANGGGSASVMAGKPTTFDGFQKMGFDTGSSISGTQPSNGQIQEWSKQKLGLA